MYCKKCGQFIDDDSVFCKYCGSSQGIPIKIGIINKRTSRSAVVEIDSSMSVSDFVSYLIQHGWVPNHSVSISTLTILAGQEPSFFIYNKKENPQNKSTLFDTLSEHNSDDVIINYLEQTPIREEYHYHHRGYNDTTCLYGCPSSEKNLKGNDKNAEIESFIF